MARRRAADRVASGLASDPAWQHARTIAAFVSLPDEIDTEPSLRTAFRDGKRVLLPRALKGGALEFVELGAADDDWRVGRHGVREPSGDPVVRPLESADVVLVPGLAFDALGGRLGRGAGYYDRALAPLSGRVQRPALIGIAFAVQLVSHVPRATWDVCVDRVVTDRGPGAQDSLGTEREGSQVR